ncbi:hypothetical protein Trydic_g20992 [Trypoxylus dichotomus]
MRNKTVGTIPNNNSILLLPNVQLSFNDLITYAMSASVTEMNFIIPALGEIEAVTIGVNMDKRYTNWKNSRKASAVEGGLLYELPQTSFVALGIVSPSFR